MALTFNPKIFQDIEEKYAAWKKRLSKVYAEKPERLPRFSTVSDNEIKDLYTPADVKEQDFVSDIGFPGTTRLPAGSSRPCIGAVSGPCACLRVLAAPKTPTGGFISWSGKGRPVFQRPSICPP